MVLGPDFFAPPDSRFPVITALREFLEKNCVVDLLLLYPHLLEALCAAHKQGRQNLAQHRASAVSQACEGCNIQAPKGW